MAKHEPLIIKKPKTRKPFPDKKEMVHTDKNRYTRKVKHKENHE